MQPLTLECSMLVHLHWLVPQWSPERIRIASESKPKMYNDFPAHKCLIYEHLSRKEKGHWPMLTCQRTALQCGKYLSFAVRLLNFEICPLLTSYGKPNVLLSLLAPQFLIHKMPWQWFFTQKIAIKFITNSASPNLAHTLPIQVLPFILLETSCPLGAHDDTVLLCSFPNGKPGLCCQVQTADPLE